MTRTAVYKSPKSGRSLWQEYRICEDRVEFATLLGLLTVPFDQIERVAVSESDVKALLKGNLGLKNFRPALKLDWANFVEHVVLDKRRGRLRRVLFTPDDPKRFKAALDRAMAKWRAANA